MKRAEILKWAKENGITIPFGVKTHEALTIIGKSGLELPEDLLHAMKKVVQDAKEADRKAWEASKPAGPVEEPPGGDEGPEEPVEEPEGGSLAPVEDGKQVAPDGRVYDDIGEGLRRGPVASIPNYEAFRHLFNSLEPGRGYTLPELTELAGFQVTEQHFAPAISLDIAFPKSGGRWVRRPKNLGEHLL